jgi:hypothetical protein
MGLFDFFKKKTPDYDVTNMSVHDLDVGFIFEYDLETWEVKEAYEYDWGSNFFSREYKVTNGSEVKYLSVEEDDDLEICWMDKIKLTKIDEDLQDELIAKQKPPKKLYVEGIKFFFEDVCTGYFQNGLKRDENSWEEYRCWDFEDKSGDHILSIEQWDDESFEAAIGKNLKEYEISNILPVEKS